MAPDGSLPDKAGPGAGRQDFVLVPTEDVNLTADWDRLGRAARLDYLREQHVQLDGDIRARIPDLSVEYLSGAGSWIVRTATPTPLLALRQRLAGLPIQVADDDRFTTLP